MMRTSEPAPREKNVTLLRLPHRPHAGSLDCYPLHRHEPRPILLPPGGFTLVELLTVMAIIAVLSALAVPALTSLNKSSALNNSGRLFMNLLSVARTEAIARRTVVRLEVATAWRPDPTFNYRKYTLTAAKLNAGGTAYDYQQIGKWETVDDGVVFEINEPLANAPSDGSVYLFAAGASTPLGDEGSLNFAGFTVPTVYVAFSSTGALVEQQPPSSLPVPIRARLVEGVLGASTGITYTRHASAGSSYPASNWLDVRVNNLAGRIEIGRPESPLP